MNKIHKNYLTKQHSLGYLKYGLVIWHLFFSYRKISLRSQNYFIFLLELTWISVCVWLYIFICWCIHTHKCLAYVYISKDFVCDKYIEHLSQQRCRISFFCWGSTRMSERVNIFFSYYLASVQFSSVNRTCPTLCSPMNCSMPGFPVHHQLLELTRFKSSLNFAY